MNWNKITVEQYQRMLPIVQNESFSDLDKLVKVICVLTGLSEEEVDSWPLSKINDYRHLFEFDFKKEARKRIKVNGRYYRLVWQVERMPAARYIEAKTYANDFFNNIHRLMASAVMPQRKVLFWYFDKKYNAADHEKYANDILKAPFPFVYNACVFFCTLLNESIKTILTSLEKDSKIKMTKEQAKILRACSESITVGFTPLPLSQIMKESA